MNSVFHRRFQNRPRLWLAISLVLFSLAWLRPIDIKGDREPLGYLWIVFVSGQWICSCSELLIPLAMLTAFLGASAAILGWVAQAVLVIGLGWRRAEGRALTEPSSADGVGRGARDGEATE
jgi:hypothetical protein